MTDNPLVFAIDFDGTILREQIPRYWRANPALIIRLLQKGGMKADGHKLFCGLAERVNCLQTQSYGALNAGFCLMLTMPTCQNV